jgi:hypothetical protein
MPGYETVAETWRPPVDQAFESAGLQLHLYLFRVLATPTNNQGVVERFIPHLCDTPLKLTTNAAVRVKIKHLLPGRQHLLNLQNEWLFKRIIECCRLCRLARHARTLNLAGPLERLSDKYGQSCLSALLLHHSSEPALYSQWLVHAQRGPCKHTLKRQKHCQASTEKNTELDVPEDDVDIEVKLAYQLT